MQNLLCRATLCHHAVGPSPRSKYTNSPIAWPVTPSRLTEMGRGPCCGPEIRRLDSGQEIEKGCRMVCFGRTAIGWVCAPSPGVSTEEPDKNTRAVPSRRQPLQREQYQRASLPWLLLSLGYYPSAPKSCPPIGGAGRQKRGGRESAWKGQTAGRAVSRSTWDISRRSSPRGR